ncbi:hypothetical protein ACJX0J_030902, partial [Zea mays]
KQEAIFSFVSMSYLVDMQVNFLALSEYPQNPSLRVAFIFHATNLFFIASGASKHFINISTFFRASQEKTYRLCLKKFCDCIFPLYIIMRAVSRKKCLFSYNLKENPQQRKTTFLGSSWSNTLLTCRMFYQASDDWINAKGLIASDYPLLSKWAIYGEFIIINV